MTCLSDTLTIVFVVVLLLSSIILYLYTRLQQNEQKVGLLESILLDLKMSAEIQSYTELPAEVEPTKNATDSYTPYEEETPADKEQVEVDINSLSISLLSSTDVQEEDASEYKPFDAVEGDQITSVLIAYDSMTLKELQTLAKSRGITGAGTMKKGAVIEALKTSDRSLKPGSTGSAAGSAVGSSSFLETSATFSNESA